MRVQPVILCGGAGTRLWPLSREQYPKQLLSLTAGDTMLQATAKRIDATAVPRGWELADPLVVAGEEHRFITAEQLRNIGARSSAILLEPVGRSTAPALTISALTAGDCGADPVLVVMPADHVITDTALFRKAVAQASVLAAEGRIVTFGVTPATPETGYGYIQRGTRIPGSPAYEIAGFVEKPNAAAAQHYIESDIYFWNSGIFVVRASVWLKQIERLRPDIYNACRAAVAASSRDQDFMRVATVPFTACPAESIDYAVMEKLTKTDAGLGAVLPLAAGWSDVGSWDALWALGPKDDNGNVLTGDVFSLGTRDTLVRAESRMVACIGVQDAVIIETPDAILVANRADLHRVRELVAQLKADARPECGAHRKIYRPWGCYDSVDAGERFQVKRIIVNPGATLSLQMHHHRAEHWIVVAGTARVTRGEEIFLLSENQSTYIPLGVRHRLENPGRVPLELIEVQSGAYLGEDDIVRFEDSYGRHVQSENVIPLNSTNAA